MRPKRPLQAAELEGEFTAGDGVIHTIEIIEVDGRYFDKGTGRELWCDECNNIFSEIPEEESVYRLKCSQGSFLLESILIEDNDGCIDVEVLRSVPVELKPKEGIREKIKRRGSLMLVGNQVGLADIPETTDEMQKLKEQAKPAR